MAKRPPLNNTISPSNFARFYWLKKELVEFCKHYNISRQGGKRDIAKRIEHFLQTGQVLKSMIPNKKAASKFNWNSTPLTLDTLITDNYKNTEHVRAFFTKQIGKHFAFNVQFMSWMKANTGNTLQAATTEWKRLHQLKKDKTQIKTIAPQFEYNRYIRDFMKDNSDQTLKTAIAYWKIKRALPGSRAYKKTDLLR